ncbi:MAG: hypothetical protein KatS3mg028_1098 [Bacteroidia bacterium]|nr:MAG: hypothetical protein KatS3mg028_1098 [Bacteroidia bacterium]
MICLPHVYSTTKPLSVQFSDLDLVSFVHRVSPYFSVVPNAVTVVQLLFSWSLNKGVSMGLLLHLGTSGTDFGRLSPRRRVEPSGKYECQ